MKTACNLCGKQTDTYVCYPCGRDLERDLAETPWLVDELETVITRQVVYGTRGGGGRPVGKKSTPLVFDVRASERMSIYADALRDAVTLLGGRPLAEGDYAIRGLAVNKLAAWLMLHVTDLRNNVAGPAHFEAVRRAFARARSAVDRPADRWYAGPCWVCTHDLYAHVGRAVVTCECKASYDVQTRRDYLLTEAEDQLANAATIARAVSWLGAEPLTAARVRKWAERGRINAHAYDRCPNHMHAVIPPRECRACSPLYRVGDAIDLLAADTRKEPVA